MASPRNNSNRPTLFPQAAQATTETAGTPTPIRYKPRSSSRLVPNRRNVNPGQLAFDLDSVTAPRDFIAVAAQRTRRVAGTPPPARKPKSSRWAQGELALFFPPEGTATLHHGNSDHGQGEDDSDDDSPTDPAPTPVPAKPKPQLPEEGSRVAGPRPRPAAILDTPMAKAESKEIFDRWISGAQAQRIAHPSDPSAFSYAQASKELRRERSGRPAHSGPPRFSPQDASLHSMSQDHSDPWSPMFIDPKIYGKPKYRRDYASYDLAQTTERPAVLRLLAELCSGIPEEPYIFGRPRVAMRDMVFVAVHKVYSLLSLRRAESDLLREAVSLGYIEKVPRFNTVSEYMQKPEISDILLDMVHASSMPMKHIESRFAIDSTGFATTRFVKWHNKRWGKETDTREWVKGHFLCGAHTKIVADARITGLDVHDTNLFMPLLDGNLQRFDAESVASDKAYSSGRNLHLAMLMGMVPYIDFKKNTRIPGERAISSWAQMYHFYRFNTEEFYHLYHQRSNIESAMNMIKSKFGDAVRSKTDIAQANEVLAKLVCHNIVEVHKGAVMLGLDPRMRYELPPMRELALRP